MTDIHCHILPKMDDGAKSTEMSLQMLEAEAKCGVNTVVLTPHFYLEQESPDSFIKRRQASYKHLCKAAMGKLYPELRLGAEVLFTSSLSDYDMHPLCIEGTDYLLLELPYKKLDNQFLMQIHRFIDTAGVRIIIAHIERYLNYTSSESLKQVMNMDVLCQMNCESILRLPLLRKKLLNLIESDRIHLLGTDAHNITTRPVNMGEAYSYIEKKLGRTVLMENARCILDNKDIF